MAKPEYEFFDPNTSPLTPWRPVEGDKFGIMEKILSVDPDDGSYTRLLKFPPIDNTELTLTHEFWEEVYLVSGTLHDIAKNETYLPGYYACRVPGMVHGPYNIPYGAVTFEIRYYK